MTVKRRKSNWYIYLITFVVTSVLAAMLLSLVWDTIFVPGEEVSKGSVTSDVPDASNNIKVLFMLSEEKAGIPTRYMIVSYQPADEAVICIPVRSNMRATVGSKTQTIDSFYSEGGVQSVLYAIEGTMGVKCDRYVKLDRESFVSMTDAIGKVAVSCAYDVTANDGSVLFEAGSHSMSGTNLYTYINYDNPAYGEDYQSLVSGSAAVSVVNSNLRGLAATVIQSYFTKLINIADTNLTLDDYTKRQQAFLFTSTESYNPGQYYIPYGEFADGEFILSDSSKTTILERLKIEDE